MRTFARTPLARSIHLLGCSLLIAACSSGSKHKDGGPPVTTDGAADTARGDGVTTPDGALADTAHPDTAPHYQRVTINFDDLPAGTTLTNQYGQHATFASAAGCSIETSTSAGVAASQPNYIWTYYSCTGSTSGPSAPYFIDFVKPVKHVSVSLVGVNSGSKVATLRLVHSDGSSGTSDIIGLGSYMQPVVVDRPGSVDVVRLEITDVQDAYGLGVDDLAFDVPK